MKIIIKNYNILNNMNKVIGYIIFVSYNRNQYEMNNVAIDGMTIRDFIKFAKNDTISCKSVTFRTIYEETYILVDGSYENDDSVYWYVSADLVERNKDFKDFINSYSK